MIQKLEELIKEILHLEGVCSHYKAKFNHIKLAALENSKE
jgi:hypothetical protein